MDAPKWLGLEPTHNPMRWILPITPGISTGHSFLFGGCGLGAAIAALEGSSGRPVVWATAQYLSYANPPSIMDIDVTIAVAGNQITQARAVGRVGDREILTVNAALGERPLEAQGQWAERPEVPPPDDCGPRLPRFPGNQSMMDRLDVRLANARTWEELPGPGSPDGRSALWARIPDLLDMSAATLAILGDYVPFGIGQALGAMAGGNSLDNTIRIGELVPTEWVLLDIRVHAVRNGFGHGDVHLWADDGTLLATASQSTIVRYWREAPPAPEGDKTRTRSSVPPMNRFEGRTALVTGGGSGIGRATVHRLVDEGAMVLAVDRSEEGLAETAGTASRPEAIRSLTGDVADPDLAPTAVGSLDRLDLLVNGAGILRFEHSHEADMAAWDQILSVNLTGAFRFCRAAIPALLVTGGAIVNVASTSATFGHPWAAAYASSKGGLLALTRTLAVEYSKQGIRVNAVCPGSIETPITSAFDLPDGADPKLVYRIMAPSGMAGPEVVAAAIAYLGSDDAQHVNGADLRIDGATHS